MNSTTPPATKKPTVTVKIEVTYPVKEGMNFTEMAAEEAKAKKLMTDAKALAPAGTPSGEVEAKGSFQIGRHKTKL